jgi:hypothetical protein
MTEKCPGAAAKLWDDKASSICETKSTYSCEQWLLYALFLVLYLLFWMSVRNLAACNLDLRTAGQHPSILWDVCCLHINKKALLPVTWAKFMPFSFCIIRIISLLYHIILIISSIQNSIWVRIHCWKLSNWHIHHRGSVSIQTQSSLDSSIDLQRAVSHDIRCRNRPVRIGLADASQAAPNSGLNFLAPNPSIVAGMTQRFPARRDRDSEIDTNLQYNWYN